MNHGIKLADGTFFAGAAGKIGNRVEMTLAQDVAAEHMMDLMDQEKTKWVGFYVDQLVAEYQNLIFSYMQRDSVDGKVDVWFDMSE